MNYLSSVKSDEHRKKEVSLYKLPEVLGTAVRDEVSGPAVRDLVRHYVRERPVSGLRDTDKTRTDTCKGSPPPLFERSRHLLLQCNHPQTQVVLPCENDLT